MSQKILLALMSQKKTPCLRASVFGKSNEEKRPVPFARLCG